MQFDNASRVSMSADFSGRIDVNEIQSRLSELTKNHDAFSRYSERNVEINDSTTLFHFEAIECRNKTQLLALKYEILYALPRNVKPLKLVIITYSTERHWAYLAAPNSVADLYTLDMLLEELLIPLGHRQGEIVHLSEVEDWLDSVIDDPEAPELADLVEPSILENNTKQYLRIRDCIATNKSGISGELVGLDYLKHRLTALSAQLDVDISELIRGSITLAIKAFNTHAEVAVLQNLREDDALKYVHGPLYAALPSNSKDAVTLQEVVIAQKQHQRLFTGIAECFYYPDQPAYLYTFYHLKAKSSKALTNRRVHDLSSCSEISFVLIDSGGEYSIQISYRRRDYSRDAIDLIIERILSLLGDENRSVTEWKAQGTKLGIPRMRLFPWLEQSRQKYADTFVTLPEGGTLSLAELHEQANKLGNYLTECGIVKESKVVICQPRSLEFFTAMLALVKLGATYIPLDESVPQERLESIVLQLQPALLISLRKVCKGLEPKEIVDISRLNLSVYSSELPYREISYSSAAYIIFTSGSTGLPKGIEISYEALENHMHWFQSEFLVDRKDVILQKTNAGFDASVWEFWVVLLGGVNCVIAPNSCLHDLTKFIDILQKYKITLLQVVPSYLSLLMSHPRFNSHVMSIRKLFCGGEVLRTSIAASAKERLDCELVNLYGPTEACIDATYFVFEGNIKSDTVPIGGPIGNLTCKVVDKQYKPQGAGGIGELLLAGPSLFNGYYGNLEATQSSNYIDEEGVRFYRTGDIVSITVEGVLQYVGREDNQIKLNGFRVDLNAIGNISESFRTVLKAECIFKSDDNQLLLFYKSHSSDFNEEEFRCFLTNNLPFYMVPQRLIALSDFPLTPNGKVDRSSLLKIESQSGLPVFQAPTTDLHKTLASIWQTVLRPNGKVGINDNFFSLGGDSILGIKVAYELNKRGMSVSLVTLFDNPTINDLARAINISSDSGCQVSSSGEDFLVPDELKKHYLDAYPVTGMQHFMLLRYEESLSRLGVFHPQEVLYLPSSIANFKELQAALNIELQNFNFCTRFVQAKGHIFQVVVHPVKADITRIRVENGKSYKEVMANVLVRDRQTPFKWRDVNNQLIRFYYLDLPNGDAILIVSNLHAIQDGWGNVVFKNRVFAKLSKLNETVFEDMVSRPNVLREYVAQEQSLLKSDEGLVSYWREKATDFQASSWDGRLPQKGDIELLVGHVTDEDFNSLKSASKKLGVHVKSVLIAMLLTVLNNRLGSVWGSLGVVSNGRNPLLTAPLESMGLFWNLLPINLKPKAMIRDAIIHTHKDLMNMEKVIRYPISEQVTLHGNRLPFKAIFNFVEFHHLKGFDGALTESFTNSDSSLNQSTEFMGRDYFGFPVEFAFSVAQGQLSWVVHFHSEYTSKIECHSILDEAFSLIKEIT